MKITHRLSLFGVCLTLAGAAFAKPVPSNLGNGLDRLLESHLAVQSAAALKGKLKTYRAANGKLFTSEEIAGTDAMALKDNQDRILVRINLDGSIKPEAINDSLSFINSLTITAADPAYRGVGVLNAYVSLDDVAALSQAKGVRSVILELKPRHNTAIAKTATLGDQRQLGPVGNANVGQTYPNLGTYFDQGVIQHRVDAVSKAFNASAPFDYEGAGLSIACISNSYAANAAHPASLDVTNNDLPGNSSNTVNPTPVFVLQDDLSTSTSDDEGRGMCQIVYHMAPKAKVGFATADVGEVSFANSIRALAGINSSSFPNASTQGFAADVICDDVGYFDEPFYEDGIIGAGINDVAAAGVSYFSSAANDIGVNGYESVIRLVPNGTGLTAAAGNTALANTNINLTNVPTNLYAGGFHNFNPNGLDVAQTVNVAANNTVYTILQWNDPYDQNSGATETTQIYANSGTISATTTSITYDQNSTPPLPPFTAGQPYVLNEFRTSGSYDAIVTIQNPDGTTLKTQDTGIDERVVFTAPTTGQYKVTFTAFNNTTGNFSFTISQASITQYVMSDWNLLAFRTDTGAYVPASSLTTDNVATNQPIELGFVNRTSATVTSIQYVLARSNTPTGRVADHIRYLLPGNGRAGYGPQEYFTYNTVTTGGHAMAQGCNGTAAYPAFRPNIPEYFSSPGSVTVYFDKNQNLLSVPEVRLQPRIAAMDAGNISANEGLAGLGSDSTSDYDAAANFSGTSAAAPHAAACALLVLEAHGGKRSVTPTQMTKLLQSNTFPHDLDPNYSSGAARATNGGKVTLTFNSDNESNAGTGLNDPNSLAVAYTGPSYITSLVLNSQGDAAHAGNTTSGNNGLDATNVYFNNIFPGLVFPAAVSTFAVGSGSVGLTSADVTAATSNLAGPPSTTQNWTLTLNFPNNNFSGGKLLRFTISRSIQHSSVVPSGTTTANYSADLFGGETVIPDSYNSATGTYTTSGTGMSFNGTLGDGSTFSGTINNRVGTGYSVLDGYGFINVEAAAQAPIQ